MFDYLDNNFKDMVLDKVKSKLDILFKDCNLTYECDDNTKGEVITKQLYCSYSTDGRLNFDIFKDLLQDGYNHKYNIIDVELSDVEFYNGRGGDIVLLYDVTLEVFTIDDDSVIDDINNSFKSFERDFRGHMLSDINCEIITYTSKFTNNLKTIPQQMLHNKWYIDIEDKGKYVITKLLGKHISKMQDGSIVVNVCLEYRPIECVLKVIPQSDTMMCKFKDFQTGSYFGPINSPDIQTINSNVYYILNTMNGDGSVDMFNYCNNVLDISGMPKTVVSSVINRNKELDYNYTDEYGVKYEVFGFTVKTKCNCKVTLSQTNVNTKHGYKYNGTVNQMQIVIPGVNPYDSTLPNIHNYIKDQVKTKAYVNDNVDFAIVGITPINRYIETTYQPSARDDNYVYVFIVTYTINRYRLDGSALIIEGNDD